MKRGDLLLPNEYQINNGAPLCGLVLGRSLVHPGEFLVFLSNGIKKDLSVGTIEDLFTVVPHEVLSR